jgi:hypothetical protein
MDAPLGQVLSSNQEVDRLLAAVLAETEEAREKTSRRTSHLH